MWQRIKNYYHLLQALLANLIYQFPSKKLIVIGVTGTDGKTTTCHMIYQILASAGKKVSLISSIFAAIGPKTYDTGFHITTPSPFALQRFLKKMLDSGSKYAVLEITSHGLYQNRVFGVDFTVGVLTNITHEHLDYHGTFDNYLKAKAKLFKNTKISVLNADDVSFDKIKKLAHGKIITYGIKKKPDFNLENFPIKLQIPGEYNYYNALAAASATSQLGVEKKNIAKTLSQFKSLAGRLEEIDEGQDFKVIIDFAHTPNALEQALKTLRKTNKGRVISVFGAAGERDRLKRPLMGEVSAKLADFTVITAEDPRTESAENIAEQIAEGAEKVGGKINKDYFVVTDRRKAVQFAITKLAKAGDIVGIFGKGHERSMCYGKTELPWSDQDEARKALKQIKH